ncbi:MAG: DUF4258 domain-containing protein [Deltaproteobacteria bacterium]|nr:DUF4258 domain-containing protein [Deltaproteobacteria bacterium]MBI3293763.1 DUF4258 domain-containing protein [Deltaproteobacteria bacterium]
MSNLLETIRKSLDEGRFLDTRHAFQRQTERNITRPEIQYVLRTGFHEKNKDQYDEPFKAWNYAIRGKTVDKRGLRIIVSFDVNNMLIITAIVLEPKGDGDGEKSSKSVH